MPQALLTNAPLKQILLKLKASCHLAKWATKLGEFDIEYHTRSTIKSQALADFLVEIPRGKLQTKDETQEASPTPTTDKLPTSC